MRTDLTGDFETQMAAIGRAPRQLAVFHFPIAGDVYISDQAISLGGNTYSALVEDWGTLIDMAGGDPANQEAGEIRQLSMTIWNGGDTPFSDYFLKEDPENVLVDVYQWLEGLTDSDKALIDTFVVQDPINFDEVSRLLRLDFVSLAMRYDNPIGDLLTADNWPNAKVQDIGKGIDLIVGSPGEVNTLVAKTAPTATLYGSILSGTMTVTVNEDLDDLGFSTSGTIQIGEEKMRYSSRTSSAFTIVQRGWTTTAAEHLDRDEITEVISDYTFLAGKGPVSAVENVKVAGFPAPVGIYTAYPALNPARIVFSEKPYAVQYAKGSTFLEMQFDAVNAENTAWQPHLAYDAAAKASAAKINPSYPKLSLRQVTQMADRGEIVKAYLAVEHWESSAFLNDYAEVAISGIGVLGRLSRPNVADTIDIEAEADIDHGHAHAVGSEHTHAFADPVIGIQDPEHTHAATGLATVTNRYAYDSTVFGKLHGPYTPNQEGPSILAKVTGCPLSWDNLSITARVLGDSLRVVMFVYSGAGSYIGQATCVKGTHIYGFGDGSTPDGWVKVKFQTYGTGVMNASVYISEENFELEFITNGSIAPQATGVTPNIVVSGANEPIPSDKEIDDVDDLATDNVDVQFTVTDAATRSVVNLFDITDYVDFDWDWFTNKDVTVEYKGSNDAKDVYLLHAFFDVEYRKKEIVFSDDVTCEVTGLIDDGSGTYTGTPNAVITRPDHVRKYILCHRGGLPVSYIGSTSFAAAGTRYAALGYYFDGVLDANLTLRDIEKKLARQCRSRWFWNAGLAKIALREKLADLAIDRYLTADDLRLKSISYQRQRAKDIINTITLFYGRDWTSGSGGSADYKSSTADFNAESVESHGVCENRAGFLFDCVARSGMADDLLDFYLETHAYASTFYTLEGYLAQFDLEKEDCLAVTSAGFGKLRKARMVIRAADRIFGSGKLKSINRFRLIAECLRYILIEHSMADAVSAFDALAVSLGIDIDLHDLVHAVEELTQAFGWTASDTVTASEVLSIIAEFNPEFSESLTVAEVLSHKLDMTLSDDIVLLDTQEAWRTHGYGGGGYGEVGYGGYTIWRNRSPDELQAWDVLSFALTLHIGYRSGATYGYGLTPYGSGEYGDYPEKVKVSDQLHFSDGYGGPKFGGYGQAPYGR